MLVLARVRYRQPLAKATLMKNEERRTKKEERRKENETWTLVFDKPQKFVAPGQSAVFYAPSRAKGKTMLGGGIIIS